MFFSLLILFSFDDNSLVYKSTKENGEDDSTALREEDVVRYISDTKNLYFVAMCFVSKHRSFTSKFDSDWSDTYKDSMAHQCLTKTILEFFDIFYSGLTVLKTLQLLMLIISTYFQVKWGVSFVKDNIGTVDLPKSDLINYLQQNCDEEFLKKWRLVGTTRSCRKQRNCSSLSSAYKVCEWFFHYFCVVVVALHL